MHQRENSSNKKKSSRISQSRHSLTSWLFKSHDSLRPSARRDEDTEERSSTENTNYESSKVEITITDCHRYNQNSASSLYNNNTNTSHVVIPGRGQSHLYTPYHTDYIDNSDSVSLDSYPYNMRKPYSNELLNAHIESSSNLTRSATWQPSTTCKKVNDHPEQQVSRNTHNNSLQINDIPARRTSRNYAENPDVQAKLNAVLQSDKANYLSHIIQLQQQQQHQHQ